MDVKTNDSSTLRCKDPSQTKSVPKPSIGMSILGSVYIIFLQGLLGAPWTLETLDLGDLGPWRPWTLDLAWTLDLGPWTLDLETSPVVNFQVREL